MKTRGLSLLTVMAFFAQMLLVPGPAFASTAAVCESALAEQPYVRLARMGLQSGQIAISELERLVNSDEPAAPHLRGPKTSGNLAMILGFEKLVAVLKGNRVSWGDIRASLLRLVREQSGKEVVREDARVRTKTLLPLYFRGSVMAEPILGDSSPDGHAYLAVAEAEPSTTFKVYDPFNVAGAILSIGAFSSSPVFGETAIFHRSPLGELLVATTFRDRKGFAAIYNLARSNEPIVRVEGSFEPIGKWHTAQNGTSYIALQDRKATEVLILSDDPQKHFRLQTGYSARPVWFETKAGQLYLMLTNSLSGHIRVFRPCVSEHHLWTLPPEQVEGDAVGAFFEDERGRVLVATVHDGAAEIFDLNGWGAKIWRAASNSGEEMARLKWFRTSSGEVCLAVSSSGGGISIFMPFRQKNADQPVFRYGPEDGLDDMNVPQWAEDSSGRLFLAYSAFKNDGTLETFLFEPTKNMNPIRRVQVSEAKYVSHNVYQTSVLHYSKSRGELYLFVRAKDEGDDGAQQRIFMTRPLVEGDPLREFSFRPRGSDQMEILELADGRMAVSVQHRLQNNEIHFEEIPR